MVGVPCGCGSAHALLSLGDVWVKCLVACRGSDGVTWLLSLVMAGFSAQCACKGFGGGGFTCVD